MTAEVKRHLVSVNLCLLLVNVVFLVFLATHIIRTNKPRYWTIEQRANGCYAPELHGKGTADMFLDEGHMVLTTLSNEIVKVEVLDSK